MIQPPALPSSIVTEAALLGGMLSDTRVLDRIAAHLKTEDFFEPLHARIFDAAATLRAQGAENVTPALLAPYFQSDDAMTAVGGPGYMAQLTASGASLLGIKDFISQLRTLSDRRKFIVGMTDLCGRAADLSDAVDASSFQKIAVEAENVIATSQRERGGLRLRTASEAFDLWHANYNEPRSGARSRLVPPINYLMGAARPGEFTVLAGRPGMGKTACSTSYAIGTALDGFGTLFVSLEMTIEQLMGRMVCDLSHALNKPILYDRVRDQRLTPDDLARVEVAKNALKDLPLIMLEEGSFTLGDLRSSVRMAKRSLKARGDKLSIVFVDYIQLMNGSRRGGSENRTQEISELTRGLKLISKDEEVHVVGLSQLSRAVEQRVDKRPQLSDLRESGSLEQDADNVLFLFRPEYYHNAIEPDLTDPKRLQWELDRDKMANILDIIAAKLRHGRTGSVQGRFYGEYQAVRGRPAA